MSDPEGTGPADRDPESPDPVPMQPMRRSMWQLPLVRGVANGALFAVMLCVIQVYGFFRPAQPLDDETIAGNVVAGVVFGFVMYIVELWRWRRRAKSGAEGSDGLAAEAARRTVEGRLRRSDPEDRDAGR